MSCSNKAPVQTKTSTQFFLIASMVICLNPALKRLPDRAQIILVSVCNLWLYNFAACPIFLASKLASLKSSSKLATL